MIQWTLSGRTEVPWAVRSSASWLRVVRENVLRETLCSLFASVLGFCPLRGVSQVTRLCALTPISVQGLSRLALGLHLIGRSEWRMMLQTCGVYGRLGPSIL